MDLRSAFRKWFREERAKLSEMSFGQAIKYIWQYYSLYIVSFIAAVWFIVYAVRHLLIGAPEYRIYAVFANSRAIAGNNSQIWRDFVDYSSYGTDKKQVEFSTNMYFTYSDGRVQQGNEYYNSFVALTDTGTLDLITMMPDQLASLGQSGRLLNWDWEECAELREKYADRLIWYEPPEDAEVTDPVPVGIDVSDSLLVTKYAIYPESCALGIGSGSTRLDAVKGFLEFIFSPQPKAGS